MNRKFTGALLICLAAVCIYASARAEVIFQQAAQSSQGPPKVSAPAQKSPTNTGQNPATPGSQNAQQSAIAPQQPSETLRTVVIDPGHGGADTGARGPSGTEEKDIVMDFAREVGDALRAEGFTVVMTRIADVDPSLDERDTVANAQSDAIFISLHVGSNGPQGTVRTYTYLFPSVNVSDLAPGVAGTRVGAAEIGARANAGSVAPPPNFVPWREAQKPYLAQSRKLGDLVQLELSQKFNGSPQISSSAPVAVLRSVTAPAVAVEISSIAQDPQKLEGISGDIAAGIARAVAAYKSIYPPGGK